MMTTKAESLSADSIGAIAGVIWNFLDANGRVTLIRFARELEIPRDRIMQAISWLAREQKVHFDDGPRCKHVVLS